MIQQLIAFILAELAAGRSFLETDGDGITRAYVPIAAIRRQFPNSILLDETIALNLAFITNDRQVKGTAAPNGTLIVWEDEGSIGVMVVLGVTVIPSLLTGQGAEASQT
jgi:hypothetical protein